MYANALMKTLAQELSSIGEDTSDKSDEDTQADGSDQTETQEPTPIVEDSSDKSDEDTQADGGDQTESQEPCMPTPESPSEEPDISSGNYSF